ncbi:DEAD-box type RNA helicase, partial [Coemansia thaxteri]
MSAVTLAELQDLLRRKRQNFHDNGVAQEFLQKSMSFFVDGKEKCWWCVPEKRAVATDMLHIFSIQDQTPPVVNYKGALAEQLTRCTSCISAYYDSKAELRVYYSQIYSPELVNDFMLDIELWDASRIVKSLGRALTSD